jgi:hypothetical protein
MRQVVGGVSSLRVIAVVTIFLPRRLADGLVGGGELRGAFDGLRRSPAQAAGLPAEPCRAKSGLPQPVRLPPRRPTHPGTGIKLGRVLWILAGIPGRSFACLIDTI